MVEILEPNFVYRDERGSMAQLVHEGYRQVNVITSKAGSFRGGHYHRLNREAFYVVSGKLRLVAHKGTVKETRNFSEGDMFAILPFVTHDFFYITDSVLIGLYDVGIEMENGEKDIVRDTGQPSETLCRKDKKQKK